jgi:uncharacterized protein (TIGR00255 family)
MTEIRSMTGYGRDSLETSQKKITVELKSLNSKQADIMLKAPSLYNELEMDIRSLLGARLKRGKIYCQISVEYMEGAMRSSLNHALAGQYLKELKKFEDANLLNDSADYLVHILRMPDVISSEEKELDAEEKKMLLSGIENALQALDKFRLQEGKALYADFEKRIAIISQLLESIAPLEESRIENVRNRLMQEMQNSKQKLNVDQNRFEQELIFYLEKLDITEEKIRLAKHCTYFTETMNSTAIEKGKKLGFITQEMGREINTLGSKANDAGMQKIVVQMKDELEKIKEQMLNIL